MLPIFAFAAVAHAPLTGDSTLTSTPAPIREEGLQSNWRTPPSPAARGSATVGLEVYVSLITSLTSKVLDSATGETEAVAIAGGNQVHGIVIGPSQVSFRN